jgi:hypothetical protein
MFGTPDPAATRALPAGRNTPVAWGPLIALGLATVVLHVLTNRGYGVFRDEFYYLACADHPDWGYVDHPPAIAAIAWLARALFGDSTAGLRFLPALAHGLTVMVAGALARDFGGRRFAQALAALIAMLAPVYLGTFSLLTMNAFEILLWALALWVVVRLLDGGDPRLWLAFGVVAGLGLLTKHSMAFLLAGLLAGLLLTSARRQLASRWPWLAALLALVIVSPHLAWQVRHGWPTLEFLANAQRTKNYPVTPLEFLGGQIVLQGPLAFPLWLAGLGFLLLAQAGRRWRTIGWAYLFLFGVFVLERAKIYYLSPFYPVLIAAGAVTAERWLAAPAGRWLRPTLVALWVVVSAALSPLALPVLPPGRLVAYLGALGYREPKTERHRTALLPQGYADMFGWEEMAAGVARAYRALSAEERAVCAIYASNYGEAGAIDYYGRRWGLPRAISGHNSYWLWGPGRDTIGVVIVIGDSREDVESSFESVTEVGRTHCRWCMPYEDDLPIFVGRRPKFTVRELWPRTKEYI